MKPIVSRNNRKVTSAKNKHKNSILVVLRERNVDGLCFGMVILLDGCLRAFLQYSTATRVQHS